MRVAIISPGELFGGVETQIIDLLSAFRNMEDVEAAAILFHDRRLAGELRERGFSPLIVSSRHGHDPRTPRRLRELLREQGAEVLHVHGYKATVTAALGAGGSRVVKTIHGLPEPPPDPYRAFKVRCNHTLDDWATRRLRAVVCYVTADIGKRLAHRHRGLPRHVIHNGIVPLATGVAPPPPELSDRAYHVGIVGRLSRVKGIVHAIRAMTLPEMPPGTVLDIFGEGPEEPVLREHVAAAGLGGRVRFHGFRRQIRSYLAHLDCLLMPSLHEGLPYTLLEAMSLGLPIIASRVGGLAEVIADGRTGLLVAVGDALAIARAVALLAGDPDRAGRLGEAAAEDQRRRFTLQLMARRYRDVYREALGARVARGGNS